MNFPSEFACLFDALHTGVLAGLKTVSSFLVNIEHVGNESAIKRLGLAEGGGKRTGSHLERSSLSDAGSHLVTFPFFSDFHHRAVRSLE